MTNSVAVSLSGVTSLGYQQVTNLSSAVGLPSIPTSAITAIIYVEAAGVRWRDDGTSPTASVGMPLASGQAFQYSGPLGSIKFIQQTSGAILNVTYLK